MHILMFSQKAERIEAMKKENVKIKASICIPACCQEKESETQNDFYENEMEKLFEEIENEIAPKVCDAVSGFVYLAEEVLSVTERNRVLEFLERLEYEGDGDAALDLLYGMLLAAGLKEHAKAVLDAIHFGEEYQIAYMSFMEEFFDDYTISNYLVSNWLMTDGQEESAGGVLS